MLSSLLGIHLNIAQRKKIRFEFEFLWIKNSHITYTIWLMTYRIHWFTTLLLYLLLYNNWCCFGFHDIERCFKYSVHFMYVNCSGQDTSSSVQQYSLTSFGMELTKTEHCNSHKDRIHCRTAILHCVKLYNCSCNLVIWCLAESWGSFLCVVKG